MRILLVFSLIIAIVAVMFAAYNGESTLVSFGPLGALRAPLSVVLLATLAIGVIIGIFGSLPATIAARREAKRLRAGGTTPVTTGKGNVVTSADPDESALIEGKAKGPGGFNPYEPIKP